MCEVQGSPLPDVQWIAPNGVLEGDTAFPLSQDTAGQYRASSQLLDVQPGGQYICAASNSLGKDQATLYLLSPSPGKLSTKSSFSLVVLLLALALATKLILAVGVGAWVLKKMFSGVEHWKGKTLVFKTVSQGLCPVNNAWPKYKTSSFELRRDSDSWCLTWQNYTIPSCMSVKWLTNEKFIFICLCIHVLNKCQIIIIKNKEGVENLLL